MKNTLTKGNNANYEIQFTVDGKGKEQYYARALTNFQKDYSLAGFRKGHVPLQLVKEHVSPEYLDVAVYEEIVNQSIKLLLDENKDIKFIGQPYDLNKSEKGDSTTYTYKIDEYPEVVVKNKNREKVKITQSDSAIEPKEFEAAFENLKQQYAEYVNVDEVSNNTLEKISFDIKDKSGESIEKGTLYLNKEDKNEFSLLQKHFEGQKKGEESEIKYDEKKLPATLHLKSKDKKADKISFTLQMIQEVKVPEFNDQEVERIFGKDGVNTRKGLENKIMEVMTEQKSEQVMMTTVENILQEVSSSLEVSLPKTLLDEEMKARLESMQKRFGGEQGLKNYFEKIGNDETQKLYEEIKKGANESLAKFFILRKLIELMDIPQVNWNSPFDPEKKLLEALKAKGMLSDATEKKAKKSTKEEAPVKKSPSKGDATLAKDEGKKTTKKAATKKKTS